MLLRIVPGTPNLVLQTTELVQRSAYNGAGEPLPLLAEPRIPLPGGPHTDTGSSNLHAKVLPSSDKFFPPAAHDRAAANAGQSHHTAKEDVRANVAGVAVGLAADVGDCDLAFKFEVFVYRRKDDARIEKCRLECASEIAVA